MKFTSLILTSFKNYTSSIFNFDHRIVGICGHNGKGKTNLIDALHYLSFTKSYFSKIENGNVHFNCDGFRLQGKIETHLREHDITSVYKLPTVKEFYLDEVAYEKFSHHVGKFPCVMVAPDDIEIITGPGELRRKFLDMLISQADPDYLQNLITYNKVLAQRNSFLKQENSKNYFNNNLLDVFDEQLVAPAGYIHSARKKFSLELFPLINHFYKTISGDKEIIRIEYSSMLNQNNFAELLIASRQKDKQLQRTNVGIHRDDLIFYLDQSIFKNVASQGQRKTLLFASKLAEFEILKKIKGFAPVLLLDDVFEKLDEKRMKNLLTYVCKENDGQVFITDTHKERLIEALEEYKHDVQVVDLNELII
ncbi:MAG: DNA replication and repair protein RecF [Ginsengibacter sp.]